MALTIAQQIAQAQAMLNQTKAEGNKSFAGSSYASPSYVPQPTQNAPVLSQPQLTQIGQQNAQATGTQTYKPPQNTTLSTAPMSATPTQNQNLGIGTPAPTMPPPPPTSSDTTPIAPPQENPYAKQYESLLKPTDTENQLSSQQIALQDSYNKGTVQNEGALAPMSAISGDQQLIDKSFNLNNQTLTQRLALEQSKRQNAIDVSKFAMERTDKQIADKEALAKEQRGYDQQLALAQAKTQPQSPSDIYGTGSVGEYNFAVSQGYKGTFSQYQNEDANRKAVIAKAGAGNGSGLTPNQINSTVNQIAGAFDNEPIVKAYNTVQEGFQTIKSIGVNTKSPADDIAFIYAFAKIMDPNSVVREGEYNTIQKYAQTWAANFGFTAQRVFSNTNFLTSDAKQKMLNALQPKVTSISSQYENLNKEYQRQVNDAYAGKPRQITDYAQGNTQTPPAEQTSSFDSLANDINPAPNGKDAYIPRSVWTSVQDKDGLLKYVKTLGFNLLVQ